jgi:hypothetical protein
VKNMGGNGDVGPIITRQQLRIELDKLAGSGYPVQLVPDTAGA